MAEVIQSLKSRLVRLPVKGLTTTDVAAGALMMPGVTAETDLGIAIAHTASSNANALGILGELHDYSVTGNALVDGTVNWFGAPDSPSHPVELIDGSTLVRVDYNLSGIGTASSSTTTVTLSSLEDNIDTSFIYCTAGTGIGQLRFAATSASGSCVVSVAPTVALASASIEKILRLFHNVVVWKLATATAPTKLDSTAAAGTGRALILERHIVRNGMDELMSPLKHGALDSLNSLSSLKIYSVVQIQDTAFHPVA